MFTITLVDGTARSFYCKLRAESFANRNPGSIPSWR